jgi:hypothetical protein
MDKAGGPSVVSQYFFCGCASEKDQKKLKKGSKLLQVKQTLRESLAKKQVIFHVF